MPPPRVLVVDPAPVTARQPCIAAQFVVTEALSRGFRATLHANSDPLVVLNESQSTRPDTVVLVLHGGLGAIATATNRTPWDALGRMVCAYRSAGARVVAFDAGAMAAVIAIFVQHGAVPVFELDTLFEDPTIHAEEARRRTTALRGLEQLTPHERSVLFQLIAGHTAGEIAPNMAISLSTVRAHIRSILRKLQVNSQLAAVALAHGTYQRDQEAVAI